MTGYLYFNKSPRNQVNKVLQHKSNSITIRYKETTGLYKPDLLISNTISLEEYNYIHVGGDIDRYYYIDSFDMAQQYYILHCTEDVLMSFKDDIYNTTCIVAKNQGKFNAFLNDNRMKLYNKSRILTKPFDSGFYVGDQKVWTMVLTVNGSGSATPSNNESVVNEE